MLLFWETSRRKLTRNMHLRDAWWPSGSLAGLQKDPTKSARLIPRSAGGTLTSTSRPAAAREMARSRAEVISWKPSLSACCPAKLLFHCYCKPLSHHESLTLSRRPALLLDLLHELCPSFPRQQPYKVSPLGRLLCRRRVSTATDKVNREAGSITPRPRSSEVQLLSTQKLLSPPRRTSYIP